MYTPVVVFAALFLAFLPPFFADDYLSSFPQWLNRALTFLNVIAGKPVFLYGPPGTAKSFIAKRVSYAFKDSKYFGYLMQRFSTPEDIFGPVSLEELKNDKYIRKIKGYLPDSDFAFLDEIWKSAPAILNTLLTIINERIFKNGYEEIKVPLKGLISIVLYKIHKFHI